MPSNRDGRVERAGNYSQKGMTLHDVTWRKSSRSAAAGHCVEIASADAGVLMRDSKDAAGPVLRFGLDGWTQFIAGVQGGEFDRVRGSLPGLGRSRT